jgi:hypothetical protein
VGVGLQYKMACVDTKENPLDGGKTYKLAQGGPAEARALKRLGAGDLGCSRRSMPEKTLQRSSRRDTRARNSRAAKSPSGSIESIET